MNVPGVCTDGLLLIVGVVPETQRRPSDMLLVVRKQVSFEGPSGPGENSDRRRWRCTPLSHNLNIHL